MVYLTDKRRSDDTSGKDQALARTLTLGRLMIVTHCVSLGRDQVDPLQGHRGDVQGQPCRPVREHPRPSFRVCFRWTDAGPEDVEIVDYH